MDIKETRLKVFKKARFQCQVCGLPFYSDKATPQLAHQIKQSKYNIKKYGKEVIHHPLNLKAVCSLSCNAKADLGVKEELIKKLVMKINIELMKNIS